MHLSTARNVGQKWGEDNMFKIIFTLIRVILWIFKKIIPILFYVILALGIIAFFQECVPAQMK